MSSPLSPPLSRAPSFHGDTSPSSKQPRPLNAVSPDRDTLSPPPAQPFIDLVKKTKSARHNRAKHVHTTLPGGVIYEGEWRYNQPHGRGKMTYSGPGGFTYDGEWKKGQCHGRGTMTDKNGTQYTGGWSYDQQDGEGTITSSKGVTSEGIWKKGNRVQ